MSEATQTPRSKALVFLLLSLGLIFPMTGCLGEKDDDAQEEKTETKVESPQETGEIDSQLEKLKDLKEAGRYADAKKLAETILKSAPGNMVALRAKGMAEVSVEQFEEASSLAKQAKNKSFLNRHVEAYHLLKKANALDPNSDEIRLRLAGSALHIHRHHEAASMFKSIFDEDRSRIDALVGWSESAFGSRNFEQCLAALDNMMLIEQEAEKDERIAAHLCELWYIKGVAASALYRYAEAIDVLNRASKREPNKARYRDALAAAQLEAGNFEAALSDLKVLEKISPDARRLHYQKGKAYERLGKKKEAVASYREELRRDKNAWRVAVDCARAYETLGGRDNLLLALSFLEQALVLNPRSHEARFTQQAVYRKLGNRDESKRVNALYQKLIDFKGQREKELRSFKSRIDADPRDFEAWLGTIAIRTRYNPVEDVLREVHKMLNIEPNHPEGLFHLINLYLVQEKHQLAWYKATMLMDTAPNDSRGFSLAATALFRMKRLAEAQALARQAFNMNKRDGAALEILVQCLQKTAPNGEELSGLYPLYQRMKAEEAEAIKRLQQRESKLNSDLGN